jgi:hypothetical protein
MASKVESELRELVLALALFLAGLGYAVSGLPANVVVGCVIWLVAWFFITHLFFIADLTQSCPTDVKIIFWGALTFLVVLALLRPVQEEYAKEHAPSPPPEHHEPAPPAAEQPAPLPRPVRTYLAFDGAPRFPEQKDEKGQVSADQNFRVGNPLSFNYYFKVTGPNSIESRGAARELVLEPNFDHKTQLDMIADFKKKVNQERKMHPFAGEPETLMPGDSRWSTVYAWDENKQYRLATRTDLDALRFGTQVVFVLVELPYTDNGKLHHLRTCQYLQPPAIPPGIWHFCDGFTHSD